MTYNNEGEVYVPVTQITYRDRTIDIYYNDSNHLFFAAIENKMISNESIEDLKLEIKYRIDNILDVIKIFNDCCKLEYFDNAGYRDIRLIYNRRVLKVYLVSDLSILNIDKIICEAERSISLYEKQIIVNKL